MNVTRSQLRNFRNTPIERVEVVSLEGRSYIARFQCEGSECLLTGADGRAIRFDGASCVRGAFAGPDVRRFEVLPPAGTDEMIGMPVALSDETMRAPL